MKRCVVLGLIAARLLCGAPAAEAGFTSTVSPEDLAAAGLTGLNPAQITRLNALVEDYKNGIVASARRAVDDARAAKLAAEAQAARAEQQAQVARLEAAQVEAAQAAAIKRESAKAGRNLLPKAKGLLKPSAPVEEAAIESSIPGKFRGWEPRQVFMLANGQRWQVANNESYYVPMVENPKVVIVPAALAGYWLRFPNLGTQVRVSFVGDQ